MDPGAALDVAIHDACAYNARITDVVMPVHKRSILVGGHELGPLPPRLAVDADP